MKSWHRSVAEDQQLAKVVVISLTVVSGIRASGRGTYL